MLIYNRLHIQTWIVLSKSHELYLLVAFFNSKIDKEFVQSLQNNIVNTILFDQVADMQPSWAIFLVIRTPSKFKQIVATCYNI